MNLKNIQFKVKKNTNLDNSDKKFLFETFRMLFNKKYGYDLIDEYFKTDCDNTFSLTLKNVKNNNDLICIYDNDILKGGAIVNYISKNEIDLLDIAIDGYTEEEKREVWKLTVDFALKYFKKLGYKKIYLEIPVKDPFLLVRANDLGFKEDDTLDISYDETIIYLYSKELNNE